MLHSNFAPCTIKEYIPTVQLKTLLHTCQPSRILRGSPAFSIKFFKNPALTISPDGNCQSPGILRSPPARKLHLTKLCFTPFARVCHASRLVKGSDRRLMLSKHLAQSN